MEASTCLLGGMSLEEVLKKKQEFESKEKQLKLQHEKELSRVKRECLARQEEERNSLMEEYQSYTEENIIAFIKEKSGKLHEKETQRWNEVKLEVSKLQRELNVARSRSKELQEIFDNLLEEITQEYVEINRIPNLERYNIPPGIPSESLNFLEPYFLVEMWSRYLGLDEKRGLSAEGELKGSFEEILNRYGNFSLTSNCCYPSPLELKDLMEIVLKDTKKIAPLLEERSLEKLVREMCEVCVRLDKAEEECISFSRTFYTPEMRAMADDLAAAIALTNKQLSFRLRRDLITDGHSYIGEGRPIDWNSSFRSYYGYRISAEHLKLEKH